GRRLLLGAPTDLADHDDAFGLRIVLEHAQHIDETGAVDRVTADPDAGGLADANLRQLMDCLVRQRPAARHHADRAGLVDIAGHDADLTFTRSNHSRTVRADEAGVFAAEITFDPHHIQDRNAFGDANY